jgi:HEAT repeat protein
MARSPSKKSVSASRLAQNDARKLRAILKRDEFLDALQQEGIISRAGAMARQEAEELGDALVACLEDRNAKVRINALNLLGQIGPRQAEPAFLRLIGAEDRELRNWAAVGLKQLQLCDAPLLEPLLGALENHDQWVRLQACEALYRIDSAYDLDLARLFRALAVSSEPSDLRVGETAAWLVARNTRKDVAQIADGLGSTSPDVRLASVKAIGYLGESNAAIDPLLQKLREDENAAIRGWAVVALAQSHSAGAGLPDRWASLTSLLIISSEDDPSPELAASALRLLAAAGEAAAESVPTILTARRRLGGTAWEVPIEAFGSKAIGYVRDALAAGTVKDYEALVWLARLRDPGALSLADEIVKKGHSAHYAAVCYGLLGREGLGRVRALFGDASHRSLQAPLIRGLRYADTGRVPLISAALRTGSPAARTAAARLVGDISEPELIPELDTLTDDSDDDTRIATLCSLLRLGRAEMQQALVREWEEQADVVAVEVTETRTSATQLLPACLSTLSDPATSNGAMAAAVGVIAAHASEPEKDGAIEALRGVRGLWMGLRQIAVETAARLQNPGHEPPFPSPS